MHALGSRGAAVEDAAMNARDVLWDRARARRVIAINQVALNDTGSLTNATLLNAALCLPRASERSEPKKPRARLT